VIRIVRFDRIQPPLTTSLKAAPSDRKTGLGAAATGARYFFQDLHVVDRVSIMLGVVESGS
jgi:hypothetical protein